MSQYYSDGSVEQKLELNSASSTLALFMGTHRPNRARQWRTLADLGITGGDRYTGSASSIENMPILAILGCVVYLTDSAALYRSRQSLTGGILHPLGIDWS